MSRIVNKPLYYQFLIILCKWSTLNRKGPDKWDLTLNPSMQDSWAGSLETLTFCHKITGQQFLPGPRVFEKERLNMKNSWLVKGVSYENE